MTVTDMLARGGVSHVPAARGLFIRIGQVLRERQQCLGAAE